MAKEQIISAIDVGSSKIVCLIAEILEDKIQIIGVSTLPSRGIKKGVVVDIDEAVEVLSEGMEAAERMAGVSVSRVWVTVNGSHISSVNSQGVVAVSAPDGEISVSDVNRVTEAARAISMPSSREIIHVIPRTFIVDSQEGIDDPVGMSGVRLQVETHIVSGATTSMRNLVKCIQQVGLDAENLTFTGLAASESVLSETEKELGVVVADIGGGTSNICIFVDGSPVYSSVLKLGGKNITSDIAIGLRVSLEEAEEIKKYMGVYEAKLAQKSKAGGERSYFSGATTNKDDEDIDISSLGLPNIQKVNRKFLIEGIIQPRLEEIADEIQQEIKKSGYEGLMPAGVVVAGGTALTVSLKDTFSIVLNLPVRIAEPTGVSGLIDEVNGPAFAASIGGIIYAAKNSVGGVRSMVPKFKLPLGSVKSAFDRVVHIFKGFMP
ncbi:cell division protein FtsA [candidate division WWE3 bacterium]|nr:cell division protein FtsA [candidate division WWE3 bacterium]